MKRRLIIAGILSVLLVGPSPAAAHEEYRVIGTITKVTATILDVKQSKDNKTISMLMNEFTLVVRDKQKISAAELKTGLSVVVDAAADTDMAEVVRIVPPLA